MSALNKGKLALQAADAAYRVGFVRDDPAVRKAAARAWQDIKVASKSSATLGSEINSAWARSRRSGPRLAEGV